MSDITKMIRISELQSQQQKLLFCHGDGETVLGIITYENGDVYMGEIKPDEAFDGKRDRRRHGYGKLLAKRGKTVDGQWHLGLVIGKSIKYEKSGRRTVEVRSNDPSHRAILCEYYLTEDDQYGGDRYNGLCADDFMPSHFMPVLERAALREQLLTGEVPAAQPKSAPKQEAKPKPAPAAKPESAPKQEAKPKSAPKQEAKPKPAPAKKTAPKAAIKEEAPQEPAPAVSLSAQAAAAARQGDTQTAVKLYFEAAKYADVEAAKAYVRLAAPGLYAPVDRAYALKSGEKLGETQKKLYKLDKNLFGKATVRRFDGTGMKLLEKAGYGDSPYADRLKAACFWPDSKQRIHYLTLAADRGDYLAIDELLAYYARSATRDFAKKLYGSMEALDKLWHNVFLLFASAELRLPWFTHENLRLVYDRLDPALGPNAHVELSMRALAKALTVLVDNDVLPPKKEEQKVVLREETKIQLHRWLTWLLENCKPENPHDLGRYHLAFMHYEGYGCPENRQMAEKLLTEPVSTGRSVAYVADQLDRGSPMVGPVAYILAESRMRSTGMDKEAKQLLNIALEGKIAAFRQRAQEQLELFIEDDTECFNTALAHYNAGRYRQAVLLWRRLADKGNAMACRNVAAVCMNHLDDDAMAERYAEKGSALGDIQCMYAYANRLRERGEYKQAYAIYEQVSAKTDSSDKLHTPGKSLLAMAEMLYDGQVAKVYAKEHAIYYAHRAQQLGAEVSRGFSEEGTKWMMAYKARTVSQDFADFALQKGAQDHNPYAYLELGIKHLKGDGVEQDPEKGEELLRKGTAGTRREYYMMYRRVIEADSMYNSESDELRSYAIAHLYETASKIWERICSNEDYYDAENLDTYMDVLIRFSRMEEAPENLDEMLELKDEAAAYALETEWTLPRILAMNICGSAMRVAESCGYTEDAQEMMKEYLVMVKEGVSRGIRTAEEEAQKMLCTDENVRYMMALSVCSQSDREGMALLRFVQGYLSDEPMGDYLRGVYYSGLYTTENKPLDTDLARICLKRAAESGFEKADDAYFRLSNLELKKGNVAQCEVYLKKAARMGHENARAVCEECGYTW